MPDIRDLTILHSNDLHGDFLAEDVDASLVGGVSMLSGYLNKVRIDTPNVLYAIAGDMFRGSVIDSEFKGVSTIDIMNYLAPDIVSLGNHEMDYGISHLVFLERCTKFPIVNANLYVKINNARLFDSHKIIRINGMKILFIGIITQEVLSSTKSDALIGTLIDVNSAAEEVGKICNTFKAIDIDLTVLLTHIGFEEDKKLAALLDPAWGVDLLIGGHSHTLLEKPVEVNGVVIAQAGQGTDQIGRFDLKIDKDTNSIASYEWQLVPINATHCPRDAALEKILDSYKSETDRKYKRIITHFPRQLIHPKRNRETEVGNLFADLLKDALGCDIVLCGSGSLRMETFGPLVEFGNLVEMYPYDDEMIALKVSGAQLRAIITYILRDDFLKNETEFYQVPRNVHIRYDCPSKTLLTLEVDGKEVVDDDSFTLAVQKFHYSNFDEFFGFPLAELTAETPAKTVATSCIEIFDEMLSQSEHLIQPIEGRITIIGRPDPEPYDFVE